MEAEKYRKLSSLNENTYIYKNRYHSLKTTLWQLMPQHHTVVSNGVSTVLRYKTNIWISYKEFKWVDDGGVAVLLPGFAVCWQQNQVTCQPHLHHLTQVMKLGNQYQPLTWKNILRKHKNIFASFLHIEMAKIAGMLPHKRYGPIYSQYHGCRWHSNISSQGISSYVIQLILP